MNEEAKFKPTLSKPVNQQSQNFEKNFKKSMRTNAPDVKLNEVDGLLTEKEQSLKKKIFSLSKMEALVFSDPKLSAVYDEMSVNGEEKYGYHYNETIMNMLFNDYVLNSPKYLQKYKMAIPKEKKRRDQSGINQLKKAGEEVMKKSEPKLTQSGLPKQEKKPEVAEANEPLTKVQFLVNEKDPENKDVFAYFPEEIHNGEYRTAYSHVGQHSSAHPDYAAESRPATPEEYADLKAELENIGYNLEVLNQTNETTGSASSGAYVGPAAWKKGGDLMEEPKKVEETTSAGSAGGAAGYVGYAGPAAWGAGDLLKKGKTNPILRKPFFPGGNVIQESNYLTEPDGFEKFVQMLDEADLSYQTELGKEYQQSHLGSNSGLGVSEVPQSPERAMLKKGIDDNTALFIGQDVDKMRDNDIKILHNDMTQNNTMFPHPDNPNLQDDGISGINQQGKEVSKPYGDNRERKDSIIIDKTNAFTSDAVKHWNNNDTDVEMNTLKTGKMDNPNLSSMEEGCGKDSKKGKAHSQAQQQAAGIAHAAEKGEIPKSELKGASKEMYKSMKSKDIEKMASTKHKGLPEKIDEIYPDALIGSDVVDIQPQKGEKPFIFNDKKYQYEIAKYADGHFDNVVYSFSDDVYYDYRKWRELMGLKENNIKEDTQTMIQNNGTSMSNKATATGDQSSNMDMGARSSGGMSETLEAANKLLEEVNNELEAFSIHHNKLKKMSEDRKPSSLVLKDRLGNDNEKNFKSDLKDSGIKQIIDVEKELQYKDQQTDVGDDPQKLGQDIEKAEIKATDAKGEEHLKNVGDSANDEGDEIPKRNLKDEEQHEVDMYRLGQHSLVYDNEPGKRFEDRMKADMGDDIYKMRQEQMKFRAKAPMYNKDTQPVEDGIEKSQFNKEKSGWNERVGLKESVISGKYVDVLGKKRIIDFNLNEVQELGEVNDELFEVNLEGLGNTYTSKVDVNESAVKAMDKFKFFTDGTKVFATKNPVQNLNETKESDKKPVVNEQVDKMKHLLGYKPNEFVNTKGTKENRGF